MLGALRHEIQLHLDNANIDAILRRRRKVKTELDLWNRISNYKENYMGIQTSLILTNA